MGECLGNAEPVEFFSAWDVDVSLPVEKHRWITLQDFLAPEFYFAERQLTFVYKDQNSLQAAKGANRPVEKSSPLGTSNHPHTTIPHPNQHEILFPHQPFFFSLPD